MTPQGRLTRQAARASAEQHSPAGSTGSRDEQHALLKRRREVDSSEADLRRKIAAVRDVWSPTEGAENFMRDLCNSLHLSMKEQTAGITSQAQYSAKLNELAQQRKDQQTSDADAVSPAQYDLLVRLGIKADEISTFTKATATERISELMEARERRAPTNAQLKLLHDLGHKGAAPVTLTQASTIISQIKRSKKRAVFRRDALRHGYSEFEVNEMVHFMDVNGLWEEQRR